MAKPLAKLLLIPCIMALALRAAAEDDGDTSEAERTRRGEFMKADLDRYTIVADDRRETPLSITAEPVLRFTNPVRNSLADGTVFLWLEGKRPLAAAVVSIREKGNAFRELVTFTDRTLECRREGQVAWKPVGGNLVDQPLDDAAPPDASDKRRLRQMRDVARRFRIIKKSSPDVDLRLMGQPIYRYTDENYGVIDGAVFALVEATDPDFLLVVETACARSSIARAANTNASSLCVASAK